MMRRVHGFTLLEMLAAIAVFAVFAAMAYGSLNALLRQHHAEEAQQQRLAELQRAVTLLGNDLVQVVPRGIREPHHGDHQPAFTAGEDREWLLEWTRGGWSNPGDARRTTLQRVAWHVEDGTLLRIHWPLLDRAPQSPVIVTDMLEEVVRVEWRLLDDDGDWHEFWPPPGSIGPGTDRMPRALELTLVLEDWGRLERLFVIDER